MPESKEYARHKIKRIPRNPEKFDSIDLFAALAAKKGFKLGELSDRAEFIKHVTESIEVGAANPALLHGRRVEAMFGYVAASLGNCKAIKREDAGDLYAKDGTIRPPDYRIVLDNGHEFFVEVKNHHPRNPTAPYRFKQRDMQSLISYSHIFGKEIKIAIYWSRWNIWTLTSVDQSESRRHYNRLELPEAAKLNEMAILGDHLIGTTPPLVMRFKPDADKPTSVTDTNVSFTIGSVEFFSGESRLDNKHERDLANYLILFGGWRTSDPRAQVENERLQFVEIVAAPETQPTNQQFAFVGDLSGMISKYYNLLTAPVHAINQLIPAREPGSLGIDLPLKGRRLQLWRFTIHPANDHKEVR